MHTVADRELEIRPSSHAQSSCAGVRERLTLIHGLVCPAAASAPCLLPSDALGTAPHPCLAAAPPAPRPAPCAWSAWPGAVWRAPEDHRSESECRRVSCC